MAAIDSAYQYYLSTYAGRALSRYDTHKKSELRDVYNLFLIPAESATLFQKKLPNLLTKILSLLNILEIRQAFRMILTAFLLR